MRTPDRVRHTGQRPARPRPDRLPRLLPAGFAGRPGPPGRASGQVRPAAQRPQRVPPEGADRRGGAIRAHRPGRRRFPTARKLAAVAAGPLRWWWRTAPKASPASSKDKVLLARSPHLVLDGAVLAAELVGARQVFIVCTIRSGRSWTTPVTERRRAQADRVRLRVVTATDRFVAGEASAVVHWIERGIPTPTARPPRLSDRGLAGRPTLVQNVETLAHLALIGRYGAAWFRALGTADEPGTMLVTILGAVREPCVTEIAIGTPVGEVLQLADGAAAPLAGGAARRLLRRLGRRGRRRDRAVLQGRAGPPGGRGGRRADRGPAHRRLRDRRDRPGGPLPRRSSRPGSAAPACSA